MPISHKKSSKKIVLGVDPGFADLGFGVIEATGNSLKVLDYGSIKTSPKDTFVDRLHFVYCELTTLIKKYKPDVVAVEEIFFSKNIKTAIKVAHARGAILLAAREHECTLLECSPQEVKMAVSGYGNADKKQVQRMIQIILGLKTLPQPDDAADALACAIWGSNKRII